MEAKRIYKGKDSDMTKAIREMLVHFESNLAAFTAFDPSFDAAFLTAWKTAKENVLISHEDFTEVVEGEILMETIITALDKCRTKYIEVKYFAGKTFPNNKEAMKEFGEGAYSKVRNSPLRMVQFTETLFGVATKYKVQLIAQGYTQPAITEIVALANELSDDNNLQQLKKKERPTQTRTRIETLNTFYGFGQQVAAVAPLVFANSYALRKQFYLAERQHQKIVKNWLALSPTSTRKIALPKLLKKFNLTLTNQGKETIEYWRAENIHETPFQKFYLDAEESIAIEPAIPARKFLVLRNPSQKEVRVMMKKEMKEK